MKQHELRRAMRISSTVDVYPDVLRMVTDQARVALPADPDIRRLSGMIRARNWSQVVATTDVLGAQQYTGVLDLYVKTQLVALVKKYPFSKSELPGFDPEAAGWKKFQQAEHRCKRINLRSSLLRYGVGFRYGPHLEAMREYIRRVLGPRPVMSKIYDLCDFGPGASVRVSGNLTNVGRKLLAKRWTVTRLALPYAAAALHANEQIRRLFVESAELPDDTLGSFLEFVKGKAELVTHNNINFVPKTYKTHRSIASEPLLNGFLQKGIDEYMRARLARAGVTDLTDQEPNQLMARDGSRGGFNPYATIDLSSASDSLSIGICKTLLPPEWYDLLEVARSHQYRYRGSVRTYEKVASMGNGFCFPLQTLVFSAACYAACVADGAPLDFRVYGDDIIVRQSEALLVIELLRYLGFKTNRDKTFVFGPFRESCGADWYGGLDVRPAYLDFRFCTAQDLYKFHNSTLRSELTMGLITDEIREKLRRACPPAVRFVRPYHGNPDSAFTVPKDISMSCPFVRWERDTWSWSWRELKTLPSPDKLWGFEPVICDKVKYVAFLRNAGTTEGAGCIRHKDGAPLSQRIRNPEPLTIRRKARVSVRRESYWGPPGHVPWKDADLDRARKGAV